MNLHLNTLFVTAERALLHKEHETVVVKIDGEVKAQLPMLHLASVVCFGRATVTPDLMAALAEAGVHVAFLSPTGRFLARVEGLPGGNVLLRRQQYRAADDPTRTLAIARSMVVGKLSNARQFLLHARRDAPPDARDTLAAAADRLALFLRSAPTAETLDALRGTEGAAAREYFGAFNALIKRNPETFQFAGRSRRPPLDPLNALLSFGYVLLMQDCAAAATGVGLDPAVGYLHEERPGRLALALDLMEELRAPIVDRLVFALVNRGQMSATDFVHEPAGGCRLTDDARKRFLVAYQESKRAELRHPFLEQDTTYTQVPHLQALLLARTLRGDLPVYPPFAIR
ncbi:type I-C CRISPR-associated endonuclease Cas1c [Chondromyces apiculatus]|uniref:CRISPR-associated endonuclease Cas1 n=1 Tax=Chondromyces apiculatus DSM 436 TaxID=1192034 RepID=A0A017T7X2_9BACT|nr:type I-C CRISPR-associated endonuclease Cas1c [Chondromyces apiculatus]EYF05344.1 CRISPR-associated protein Cas1 [Chondromyces apiculatus DSM 436]